MLSRMNTTDMAVTTEQIWRELSNRLRQFIRSRVNSAADTDDILQTVFVRIHNKLDVLEDTERLESWVFQITRNAIVDHYRKSSTDNRRFVQDDLAMVSESASIDDPNNLNSQIASCLGTLIQHLPEQQKRAVSMYELKSMSQKEIAEIESISLSGAKSRIQRGRKKLEAMLRECCELEFDRRGNVIACGEEECTCDNSS